MPSKVFITSAGAKRGLSKKVLTFIKDLSDRQLSEISNRTATVMQGKIKESISRAESTGNLENSIYAVKVSDGHYGVGDIGFMNVVVPYWNHVDKGSIVVGASHSHKVPVGGFNPGFTAPRLGGAGQRWFVAQDGWTFTPKKPIAPLNYVAKTIQEQNRIVVDVLRTVR